ncbi:MAG: DUF3253 domain-containing protein [Asticcacaulis sp.]
MSQLVEDTLLGLLSQLRNQESISPNDVAKAVSAEGWRRELPKVRAIAIGLARKGQIEILRKGKPADPDDVRGIWRMRAVPKP